MKEKIFTVVPTWNGKHLLKPCLDSLLRQSVKHEIVIVDNGSKDGSQDFILTEYPRVKVVSLPDNRGFAGGVNAGINYALEQGADFVALLNNDAEAENDWLERLLETGKKLPEAAIITSRILRSDKKHIDSTGDFYSIWGLPFPRGRNEIDAGQYNNLEVVFGASGGASLYRSKALGQIGLFDEDFFAYFEDVDLSFRAQLAGWKVMYEPSAVVYHKVNATSSKLGNFARYHSYKNFVLLYVKNMPLKLFIKYFPLFLTTFLGLLARSIVRRHLWTFVRGTCAGLKRLPQTMYKRKEIKRSRKVSVQYIDRMLYRGRPPRPPKIGEP